MFERLEYALHTNFQEVTAQGGINFSVKHTYTFRKRPLKEANEIARDELLDIRHSLQSFIVQLRDHIIGGYNRV